MNDILRTLENKIIVKQEFGNSGPIDNFKSDCIVDINKCCEIKQEPVDSSTDCDTYEDCEQVVHVWIKDEVKQVNPELGTSGTIYNFKSECIEKLNNDCSNIKQNPGHLNTCEDSEQDVKNPMKDVVEIVDNDLNYSEKISFSAGDAESSKEITTGSATRQLCSKVRPDHLNIHSLINSDKKPHKCHLCSKEFKRPDNLKSHLLTIHSDKKTYKCDVCNKEFKRPDHLKMHLLIHSDMKQYKCQLCSKAFNRSDHLKIHLLIHSDKKPHKCEVCSKEFNRPDHLKSHLNIHSDKKAHKCVLCSKEFNWPGNLKKHMLVHSRLKPQV